MPTPSNPPVKPASSPASEQRPIRKAMDFAAVRDWPGYYESVAGKPTRDTLLFALGRFEAEGQVGGKAADLGCGEGRDTREMLRRGWTVVAVDGEPAAAEHMRRQVTGAEASRLRMVVSPLEKAAWGEVDFVNSSFTLPFCEPQGFDELWARIVGSIRASGRFAGQFFGDRDTWARCSDRTHHTRTQVERLLQAFDLEMFNEEERDDTTADGVLKHWHVFHVVGRKRAAE